MRERITQEFNQFLINSIFINKNQAKSMKKFLTMLFFVIIATLSSYAQLSESFDGTFPPSGWTISSSSALAWSGVTAGTFPTCTPQSGAGMAKCNSFSVSSGTAQLITPSINFTAAPIHTVSFWMYRDNGYLTSADKVDVSINTTASPIGATLLGTINRSINLAPVVVANGWYQYTFTAPGSFTGAANYIFFAGTSTYGNNMYMDNVVVAPLLAPGVAGIGTPATGATGILPTATLNWTAPATGGAHQGINCISVQITLLPMLLTVQTLAMFLPTIQHRIWFSILPITGK